MQEPAGGEPDRACLNSDPAAPEWPVLVRAAAAGSQGEVLPGAQLRNQVVTGVPTSFHDPHPLAPRYPGGAYPAGPPTWRDIAAIPPEQRIFAAAADARFNAEDARYRIAFHLSHYGGMPDSAGDINGDGVDDLLITDHFAYVDGMQYAGEVHLYFGRRGSPLDPTTQVPDVIFYGDEKGAKLGISVAAGGDINGDGWDDLLMSAGFHSAVDGAIPNAGQIYVVYGGRLHRYRCPVKIRAEDIGSSVPGLMLEGGHDGGRYTGWANGLEAGDFNGDGLNDVVIGSYDPYPGSSPTFAARAYVLYGSRTLPERLRGLRLGVDTSYAGVDSAVFEMSDAEPTRASLGFGAFFVGDINGDGRDELAFSVGAGGANRRGVDHIFLGRSPPILGRRAIGDADVTVTADELASPALRFRRLESARPAGDIDGDGLDDLLLTARYTERLDGAAWRRAGAAGVLYGRANLPSTLGFSELDTILYGRPGGQIGHPAMDRAADLDGDGYSDLLINDPYFVERIGGEDQLRGRLWVLRGGANLPPTLEVESSADRVLLPDTRIPGMFGYTWNTGDWNGDGRSDVVVGDHYAGDVELHEHAGRVYLFYAGSALR